METFRRSCCTVNIAVPKHFYIASKIVYSYARTSKYCTAYRKNYRNSLLVYWHTQTRHNFVGEIRIVSVKICINPYPSFMHRCMAKTFKRFMQFAKKIATLCNKNWHPAAKTQTRSFRPTSRGATVGRGQYCQSCYTGDQISGRLLFFGNLAGKS